MDSYGAEEMRRNAPRISRRLTKGGEPDAMKVASPVRRGGWGNVPTRQRALSLPDQAVHGEGTVEREKWEQTLHGCPWRPTKGVAPCAVKVACTVLNGGDEETYRKATRLVPTQLECEFFCTTNCDKLRVLLLGSYR